MQTNLLWFFPQAVCSTLLEFSSRTKDVTTHKVILGELADIIKQHCQDTIWCVELISPIILASPAPDQRLTDALIHILEQGSIYLLVIKDSITLHIFHFVYVVELTLYVQDDYECLF